MISMIFAQSVNGYIGKDGKLLFNIPEDMRRFKKVTSGKVVIMGRKTWESLPENFRPLPDRINVVLTRNKHINYPGATICSSLKEAIDKFPDKDIYIIGGESLYREGLDYVDAIYQTVVFEDKEGDARAPIISKDWYITESSDLLEHDDISYQFIIYRKRYHGYRKIKQSNQNQDSCS